MMDNPYTGPTGAAKRPFIPGDGLLPDPDILGKLFARDEQAVSWILDRMEERQKAAFAEADRASLRLPFMRAVCTRAFWRGVLSSMALLPSPATHRPATPEQAINRAWAMTGNHMRGAIRDYMAAHNVPEAVLTQEEIADLKPLDLTP